MKYGKIDTLDQEISRLVLGSMVFSLNDVFAGYALLDRFFEAGIGIYYLLGYTTCIDWLVGRYCL